MLIAVIVLNMVSKKSASRSPGCAGSFAGAQIEPGMLMDLLLLEERDWAAVNVVRAY